MKKRLAIFGSAIIIPVLVWLVFIDWKPASVIAWLLWTNNLVMIME